ncbi:alpha/beta fold hydrolase [Solitalea canadensis]|uniref:Putative hydrolase or acyltransferase of alpha/beta superfamily n=1 Tax=Solitalea canadensis (strain ATCC 29591 / DSM 3403 / JCM 21819 / LMG 8368 / NBRC 15130 / NCIMB 12057 / USAM 9D) TaxID=929556 RepID=H8KP50_SOLCM|nr:alpha/beta fold hydrolase [Solitalea canadensis]AFD05687.1 putative hydrolase or acyltransferase of alpha/beta superfamily [Solitalea canadensis DSM 3403]
MSYQLREEDGYRYIDEGQGEVLILLHGLMGALSNWEPVVDRFSNNYRVIIPMLPLYDMPLLTTGVKTLSKFLHKFVEHLNISKFTLMGNSLGGHVALIYVLNHPEFVHSLVLTGSSGLYENAMGASFPRRESYDYIKEKVAYTFYDPIMASKELVDDVFATVNDRNRVIRILAMAKSAIRHNMEKDLYKINMPVCLIWGRDDKITPPDVAEEFLKLLPNAELNWVEKCGHAPMMERPEEFNEYLDKFLKKVYPVNA